MANNSIFTEEEKAEDLKDVLEMLKVGTPYSVICDELGRSKNYIVSIKQILIANGEITQEEIDKARAEYRKNRIKEEMSERKKKRKTTNAKTEIKNKNKQKILKMFKKGYSQTEIARKLEVADSYVQKHKDELIEEGKLEKSEIKRATPQIKENAKIRNKYSSLVLEMLKKGIKKFIIRNLLQLSTYQMNVVLEEIRRKKLITNEEYEEAIKKKEKEDIIFVEESVKNGYSIKDMLEQDQTLYKSELTRMIKLLIEEGKITREKVEENKFKKFKESRSGKEGMSVEDQRRFVLDLANKGFTPRQIAEMDKTNSISFNRATTIKKALIKEGLLDSKEVNKAIKRNSKKALRHKHKDDIKEIMKYTERGYYDYEIAEKLGCNRRHISKLKSEYKKKNGWYSKEELRRFKKENRGLDIKDSKKEIEIIEKQHIELKNKAYMQYRKQQNGLIDKDKNNDIKEYLDFLRYLNVKKIEIDEKEIEIAGKMLLDNSSLINTPNLRFIITKYYLLFGLDKTIKYINRVSEEINDGEFTSKLEKLKISLSKIDKKDKMLEMYSKEENINKIANYFGLTYDDAVKVMKGNIKLEFDEEKGGR